MRPCWTLANSELLQLLFPWNKCHELELVKKITVVNINFSGFLVSKGLKLGKNLLFRFKQKKKLYPESLYTKTHFSLFAIASVKYNILNRG